ncbi:type II toxin-antitoxin system VapB family antitoxin [Methylobacterium aquaticum]|uniref:Transcription factor n=1 Tax=Methylobacterium aquaticum TaxID=270351 RepID=A0A0J6SDN3_9HYPH|nr:type II toxin-antitoxin system VapB family antitoxin [Methylobacterium aquaticum]KMO31822.1 transcription factor [Methylobacterium aquaticum]
MSLNIRSQEVNQLADKLATMAGVSKTEAVRMALAAEIARREESVPLVERIKPIQDYIASFPRTGLKADKAFFDDLNGEP